ncbi:TonB-dependent receptor plug domain-containing protein [Sphingomonas natans]|nr:TonB-dependent receptor [Sphingomonas sp. BIUV-7]
MAPAAAQVPISATPAPPRTAAPAAEVAPSEHEAVSDIVVTGTRIAREGYQAPSPTTVIGAERLATSANSNIAQFVTTLPAFVGSSNSRSSLAAGAVATTGINSVNLRGLGANRTLVLFDGHRVTPAHPAGDIDVNLIPQQLITTVDIVTGGASAVYGSDAVAGVVNFIMDKKYSGLKGEVSGGVTTYGDGENYRVSLTGGTGFADGRGHILLSGERADDRGIQGNSKRKWTKDGGQNFVNPAYTPTNGQPQFLILKSVGYTNASPGGVIVSGPLRGTAFGEGGATYQQAYGDIVGDAYMRGGDWARNDARRGGSIAPEETRNSLFGRAAFDIADHVNVYAQASWNRTTTFADLVPGFLLNTNGPLIRIDNPFLPANVRAQMLANGLTTIRVGTLNGDSGRIQQRTKRTGRILEIGTTGEVNLLGTSWSWDVYAQDGQTKALLVNPRNISRANYTLAVDAVRDPVSGAIVCRSTLTNPTNGCAPWNAMGTGVNQIGGAAYDYIGTPSRQDLTVEQDVYSASISGEPFSLPAGPVSIAISAEHRRNSANSTVDAGSLINDHIISNYGRIQGQTKVSEAALETVIPIFKNQPWADSLDLNGAVRYTKYSRAGTVATWKLGVVYSPISDIKLRATRSRDIRAPNLIETFSPPVSTRGTAFDPFTNTSLAFNQTSIGNPDLKPEIATNTAAGIVLQPSFLRGFSFSADIWDIKIRDAISSITVAQTLLLCFDGTAPQLCSNIVRENGILTQVISQSINFAVQQSRGIDFEASYSIPLAAPFSGAPGTLSFHGNATIYLKQYVNTRLSVPTDNVGENGAGNPPHWRATATASYRTDPIMGSITLRAFPSGTINDTAITCTSGCPTSTTAHPTYSQNRLPGRVYADASLSYDINVGRVRATTFVNVRNILNTPPGSPRVSSNALLSGANALLYDVEGRTFRAGLRFRL